ncbi:hypothetical protein ACFSBZ_09595 [Amnibacterium flavum]|uniref:Alternate-type signal peptide domain-containing protein n=1 Tax=Amnibacterium flavum TaxID=2173173 RepID=A0A2V1HVQ0_9MICO|nr:hypothetical protein [Amnibacterium flavum]PVZ95110.1 hypothetical protein DDQ50_00835 [Amnibacterium flavum]
MSEFISTPAPRKRNRAIAIGLAAAILTAGVAGAAVQTTGAWFTATKTATGNTVTAGTLSLGNLGDSATGLVQASNAYPMTDAQAVNAADTSIPEAVIKIRNTGTLPLTASTVLSNLKVTGQSGANLSTSNVKVSIWNGTAWGTPTLLSSIVTTAPSQFTITNLAAGVTSEIKLRVYFAGATTDDTYQGASVSFDANASAMQINKQ